MRDIDSIELSCKLGTKMEWLKWCNDIPYIHWPSDWLVKAIPPFAGAIVRYKFTKPNFGDKCVSIYLDCYDNLGCYGEPYWEVYPVNDDVVRCDMNDVKQLLEYIETSLIQMEKTLIKVLNIKKLK